MESFFKDEIAMAIISASASILSTPISSTPICFFHKDCHLLELRTEKHPLCSKV
jgi:hypothetical protein